MAVDPLEKIKKWCRTHPGIFSLRSEGKKLIVRELYSQKDRSLESREIQEVAAKKNALKPQEDYLILLLDSGQQLVLATQGFAFAPDFRNTGPIPLPSQVYCMRDFQDLFHKLKNVVSEEDRRRDALDLIMILIALLDGARAVGLEVGEETRAVETILRQLESSAPN